MYIHMYKKIHQIYTLTVTVTLWASSQAQHPSCIAARSPFPHRAHMERLMADAAAQQTQTELQTRVSSWRVRIDPILRQEEDRAAFDIHQYGERLLQRLETLQLEGTEAEDGQAGGKVEGQKRKGGEGDGVPLWEFAEVVQGADHHEISRMFAAMLQLVNNRWVRVS